MHALIKDWVNACEQRRSRLLKILSREGSGIAIISNNPPCRRTRDTYFPYRWDSDFYYLTGFTEENAVLVLIVDGENSQSILFCQEHNTDSAFECPPLGHTQVRREFGIQTLPFSDLDKILPRFFAKKDILWKFFEDGLRDVDYSDSYTQKSIQILNANRIPGPSRIQALNPIVGEMRVIKDTLEQKIMAQAAEISAEAHIKAMLETYPGKYEYEIEAALLYEFKKNNTVPAYNSIVAHGLNACTLHYSKNCDLLIGGNLLLIDAGCELEGYAADISRTFPVNGTFTKEQRELYEIVLEAQRVAISKVTPGAQFSAPHDAAVRTISQGLIDLKILKGPLEDAIALKSYNQFFMHKTSHWLGLDVHDSGFYEEQSPNETGYQQSDSCLEQLLDRSTLSDKSPQTIEKNSLQKSKKQVSRVLQPGMVLTIEPGIYIKKSKDIPSVYHEIGIRIEDDVLVTDDGRLVTTEAAPKEVSEIEKLMSRK